MVRLCLIFAVLTAQYVFSAVKTGENILCNGSFSQDLQGEISAWDLLSDGRMGDNTIAFPTGGPDGEPSVRIVKKGEAPISVALRQFEIGLSTNGEYGFSFKMRTKNLKCAVSGAEIADGGWRNSYGVKGLPQDSGWTNIVVRFTPKPSSDGVYSAVFHVSGLYSGEVEFSDARLVPLNAEAASGAHFSRVAKSMERIRIIPWMSLHEIPADTRTMRFKLFGKMPFESGGGRCRMKVSGDGIAGDPVSVDVNDRIVDVILPDKAVGGRMTVEFVDEASGACLVREVFPYRVVETFRNSTVGRRLNNLVTELVAEDVADGSSCSFVLSKSRWVFVALQHARTNSQWSVLMDGGDVINPSSLHMETFRRLSAGRHTVSLNGCSGRIVVRTIPEIINYCPCKNSLLSENPPYDWDFACRHVFRASTVQNGGEIPADKVPLLRAWGGEWLGNMHSLDLADEYDLKNRLNTNSVMKSTLYDGVTCDEQAFNRTRQIEMYASSMKAFNAAYDGNRIVYTWTIGHTPPMHHGADEEYMAAAATASQGRGRVLLENYCRTKEDESSARAHLDEFITRIYRKCRAWYPPFGDTAGVILGAFTQTPILTLRSHPEVDYKRYLDMQLNLLATDPEFKDLACTGVWGTYYADEEMHRWTFRLLRHYCVEGSTEMLSDKFGFSYIPGHLRNGDFRNSLDSWTYSGDVKIDCVGKFGVRSEGRWKSDVGLGDTFAVLKRHEGRVARLSQTATGLVPGKMYCLEASVFNAKHARSRKSFPRKFPISLVLSDGATVHPELSWVHVDRRCGGKAKREAKINLHHVVFTARTTEVEIAFDNERTNPNDEIGINYVSLTPYYDK